MVIFQRHTAMMSMRNSTLAILFVAILSSLVGCSESSFSGPASSSDFTSSYGILGGVNVQNLDPVALSAVMLINLESNEVCTGTLVSRNVVLTAAHCVPAAKENLQVFLALNPLAEDSDAEGRLVEKIVLHPNFSRSEPLISVDLAMISLRENASGTYKPASLVKSGMSLHEGQKVLLAGYGTSSVSQSEGFGRLRKVSATIASAEGLFFEIDQAQGKGICNGDSGGPVFIKTSQNVKLVGVSKLMYDKKQSGAANCLTSSQFTSLNQMDIQDWIRDFIQKSVADTVK